MSLAQVNPNLFRHANFGNAAKIPALTAPKGIRDTQKSQETKSPENRPGEMGVGPDRRDGGPAPPAGGFFGEKVGGVRARRRAGRIAAVRNALQSVFRRRIAMDLCIRL